MERLEKKYETARNMLPSPDRGTDGGRQDWHRSPLARPSPAIQEARHQLANEGMQQRLSCACVPCPSHDEVVEFLSAHHETIYVVEMNRDGQLHQICSMDIPRRAANCKSIGLLNDGLPFTARLMREPFWTPSAEEVK